jgi:uncharacterized protein (TIRG00374 family)
VRLRLWLGIAVSLVLLWVAFRGVPLDELGRSLRQVRPLWLVPVLVSILVRFWLTAIRWQVLLRPAKRIGTHRLFAVTLIGFMANNVLPARLGEFVRAYALGRAEALSSSLSFATIVVERVFDGFTLLLFLVAGLLFLDPQPWLLWSAAAAGALYCAALVVLLGLRRPGGAALTARLCGWLPAGLRGRVTGLLGSFTLGLQVFDDPRALLAVAGLSLLIWLINVAGIQAMFATFALDLPVHAAMLVQAIIAVAIVLPSAPGYVGTFQVATVAALALFAVPEATALSLSLVYHAVNYVPITVAGLVYLSAMNLTLGELRTAGEQAS